MRQKEGGVYQISKQIEKDLASRSNGLSKPQRIGLADIAASVLACGSVNTTELSSILPREVKDQESSFRYIHRWLSNDKIDPQSVMRDSNQELMELLSIRGQTLILMLDQSKIADGFELLMVSIRTKERAIPVLWEVIETQGEIGFDVQEPLLREVAKRIPKRTPVILMADRFYGTPALVRLCKELQLGYRIRLKSNLTLLHEDTPLSGVDMGVLKLHALEHVLLCGKVLTNVGYLHEPGHEEPWIIAMDAKPTRHRVLDYGLRWGIESMFSDLKSRGFKLTDTRLKTAKRLSRLLLVLTTAMMWAVSTGWVEHSVEPVKKS